MIRWTVGTFAVWVGMAKVPLDMTAVVVALGALGTGIYNALKVRQQKPVVEAEIEDRAVARMRQALDVYVQDNARLRVEVADLEAREASLVLEVKGCRDRIARLEELLRRHGVIGEI